MAADCVLCSAGLGPKLAESACWSLVLNRNQNLLGKCFWVLRRHLESVAELTADEWADLHVQLARTTAALAMCFQPDHFNYCFLQNQDRHVHLHIIPRYASARHFAGIQFDDADYPDHYSVTGAAVQLSEEVNAVLAEAVRGALKLRT
jgi:diadenosine tetraphosphate (Ap4A) HIT family hydrolase